MLTSVKLNRSSHQAGPLERKHTNTHTHPAKALQMTHNCKFVSFIIIDLNFHFVL